MSGTPGRLLSLLSLLQSRRDWPGAVLADRLDVSERTVRRDVDRLRELGYPVEAAMGPDGGYRLGAGADLPPLLFDDEQAVALAVALQLAATTSRAGIEDAAWRALATVRQVMPSRLRHRVDSVQVIGVPSAGDSGTDTTVLLAVTDAVRAHQQLRFDYVPAGATEPAASDAPRRVEPHHVVHRNGRWYLLAWDLGREDWRTFRIDRMAPRTPAGPRFTPREVPGGDVATYVAARFRGQSAPEAGDRWPCEGTVVLHRPASDVAPYLSEGTVEPVADDRCRVTTGAWSWAGLAASLARTDTDIEVVGPPELLQAFRDLARRASAAAGSPCGSR